MTVFHKGFLCAALLMMAATIAAPPAEAGFAIRLEKEVLTSAMRGAPPVTARIFPARTATGAVAAQSFGGPALLISRTAAATGAPMYRVRMDFTKTETLTRGMNLWWELWVAGRRVGARERVPQSAWALFAVEADTVDGYDAADLAQAGHDHDASYYTRSQLQTGGAAAVHWDNILNAPAAMTTDNIYRNAVTDGSQGFVACSAAADKVLGGGGSCAADGFFIASYPATDTGVDRWIVECQDALGAAENPGSVYAVCIGPPVP